MSKQSQENTQENTQVTAISSPTPDIVGNVPDMTQEQYDKLLNTIQKTGKQLREDIQKACVYAVFQAFVHENYDAASRLVLAVTESSSKKYAENLKVYFEGVGPFVWRKTEDSRYPDGKKFRKDKSPTAIPFNVDMAQNKPFWEWQGFSEDEMGEIKAKLFGTQNVLKTLESLAKKVKKAEESGLDKLANPDVDVLLLTGIGGVLDMAIATIQEKQAEAMVMVKQSHEHEAETVQAKAVNA